MLYEGRWGRPCRTLSSTGFDILSALSQFFPFNFVILIFNFVILVDEIGKARRQGEGGLQLPRAQLCGGSIWAERCPLLAQRHDDSQTSWLFQSRGAGRMAQRIAAVTSLPLARTAVASVAGR